ncbi:MAG: ATP-binding protein [Acidobacteria bacterium]|nr:ATP-binding protein [Acidobacteriota bacterium]
MPDKKSKTRRILGHIAPELFAGREAELREITSLAAHTAGPRSLLLLSAPFAGVSELLRQSYDKLFAQRGGASPIYFSLSRGDSTQAAARRFLHTFLTQLVAHRREDPTLIATSPTLRDLLELAAPSDYEWVERLVQTYERAREDGDERALVRACFGAPQQANARGARTVVMLDDVHLAANMSGEVELGAEIAQAAAQADVPFVLAGLRRRLADVLNGTAERPRLDGMRALHLEQLKSVEARSLVEQIAQRAGVALNDETRDLIVQQFEGSPYFITALVQSALLSGTALTSFREFQKLYVDELMGGRINRRFNSVLEEIVPSVALRRNLLRVLHESASNVGGKSPVEAWLRRLVVEPLELERIMGGLHMRELASFHTTFVETSPGAVWRDFLRVSYRLQVAVEPRALVVADTLVETLKRAPQTMARHYRREAALKLGDLLERFDFQRVPASLLHYDRFSRMYRGVPVEEVSAGLDAETDLIRLPQVVHTASCASFHPPILQACDEERCAVAHGFDSSSYADANEVVWIAVEIESKLEAGRALTEVWLDRLAQVAQACGFHRVRLCLVASEGFSAEAVELLNEREAFGASRQQLEFLTARLSPGAAAESTGGNEFVMEIPMGDDTELIAAHTVEQIARRMDFQPEAINQIKTALVEACINAAEHSFSPDRKIYQRFRLENDKLVVTVSSRGLVVNPIASENGNSPANHSNDNEAGEGAKGRRGWGLKLIRTLMDEVEFERVDDGTRLRMTKYLRK